MVDQPHVYGWKLTVNNTPTPTEQEILEQNGMDEASLRAAKFGVWTGKKTVYNVPISGEISENVFRQK